MKNEYQMTARQEKIIEVLNWIKRDKGNYFHSALIRKYKSDITTDELKELEKIGILKSNPSNNRRLGTAWSLANEKEN